MGETIDAHKFWWGLSTLNLQQLTWLSAITVIRLNRRIVLPTTVGGCGDPQARCR